MTSSSSFEHNHCLPNARNHLEKKRDKFSRNFLINSSRGVRVVSINPEKISWGLRLTNSIEHRDTIDVEFRIMPLRCNPREPPSTPDREERLDMTCWADKPIVSVSGWMTSQWRSIVLMASLARIADLAALPRSVPNPSQRPPAPFAWEFIA